LFHQFSLHFIDTGREKPSSCRVVIVAACFAHLCDLMTWYNDASVLDQDAVGVSVCHVLHKLAIRYRNKTVYGSIVITLREVGQNKVVNRHPAFTDLVAHIVRHIQQKK
jgi:hypothetical protein